MGFFSGLRASGLYGLAVGRFGKRKYADAARLLEKAYKLDPGYDESEIYHSYLGRSYLALGQYNEALDQLSRACQMFRGRARSLQKGFEQQQFLATLNALSDVLQKVGQLDRAREIAREAEEYTKLRASGSPF